MAGRSALAHTEDYRPIKIFITSVVKCSKLRDFSCIAGPTILNINYWTAAGSFHPPFPQDQCLSTLKFGLEARRTLFAKDLTTEQH